MLQSKGIFCQHWHVRRLRWSLRQGRQPKCLLPWGRWGSCPDYCWKFHGTNLERCGYCWNGGSQLDPWQNQRISQWHARMLHSRICWGYVGSKLHRTSCAILRLWSNWPLLAWPKWSQCLGPSCSPSPYLSVSRKLYAQRHSATIVCQLQLLHRDFRRVRPRPLLSPFLLLLVLLVSNCKGIVKCTKAYKISNKLIWVLKI